MGNSIRSRTLPSIAMMIVVVASTAVGARGQEAEGRSPQVRGGIGTYYGASTCFQCHKQPTRLNYNRGDLDWCLLTEYSTWRTVDKHSMAYAVLEGPRGREMGEKLRIDVTRPESGCLSCHAQAFPAQQLGPDFSNKDGVNCEVCHGPSGGPDGGWLGPHQTSDWRLRTPAEKAKLGLRDLRNVEVQAELCLSCHIGNAELGRVISHPMYAAGHPPLPSVDVARFVKNIPQHWRDKDQIPWWQDAPEAIRKANGIEVEKLYGAELTMVGNIVALREAMNLLADRADVNSATPHELAIWPELALNEEVRDDPRFDDPDEFRSLALGRWPEMALTHADCLSCHHELRSPGWRQRRGFVASPGRPMPRPFPLALIELNLDQYGDASDRSEFDVLLRRLNEAFGSRPFGRPDEVRDAARTLANWADAFHDQRLKSANFALASGPTLLRRLCELNLDRISDYDTARQVASAFQVIYREWVEYQEVPVPDHDRIEAILSSWDTELNLGRYPKSEQRDTLSLSILRELAMDQDLEGIGGWLPVTLGFPDDPERYWEASQRNPILLAFGPLLDPSQMRDAYVSETFKEPLQRINNDGLRIALDLASDHDPYRFRQQIRMLGGLIRTTPSQ